MHGVSALGFRIRIRWVHEDRQQARSCARRAGSDSLELRRSLCQVGGPAAGFDAHAMQGTCRHGSLRACSSPEVCLALVRRADGVLLLMRGRAAAAANLPQPPGMTLPQGASTTVCMQ